MVFAVVRTATLQQTRILGAVITTAFLINVLKTWLAAYRYRFPTPRSKSPVLSIFKTHETSQECVESAQQFDCFVIPPNFPGENVFLRILPFLIKPSVFVRVQTTKRIDYFVAAMIDDAM